MIKSTDPTKTFRKTRNKTNNLNIYLLKNLNILTHFQQVLNTKQKIVNKKNNLIFTKQIQNKKFNKKEKFTI